MKSFKPLDLVIIAICSAIGLVLKPILSPIAHIVSSPLLIPGGSLVGGIYMLWIVLACLLVPKLGTGTAVGFTQGLVVLSMGAFGSHGSASIITYLIPGVVVDIARLLPFLKGDDLVTHAVLNIAANISGSLVVALMILRLPLIPLMVSLSAAVFSSLVGGYLSFRLYRQIRKADII